MVLQYKKKITGLGFFRIYEINEYKKWLKVVVKPVENDNFYVWINLEINENRIII